MPLRLIIKKKLSAQSERVKCCDFHPTEPWILASLFSGHVFIWNYSNQSMVKSIEVCELPVRAARFVPNKEWIVCASDDMFIRVFSYNTRERILAFEAHTDYIRSLSVHPTKPLLLSSSDDMSIKLWDMNKQFELVRIYEGHTHYVMAVEWNPKDTSTFASASLDRTIKIWGETSSHPHFQLEGHERGVNCIGYYRGGDRPYLVSGADDHLIKIWDYQTKACVATLEGHTSNVSAVTFHPELPIILSGSEDGTVRVWHSSTHRLENTLNYGMDRVWTIACLKGSNKVAIGYDDGTIMIQLGHEEPVASMERGGKVVFAKNHEVNIANVRGVTGADGESLSVQSKDMGSCDIYPQALLHDPKGRLLAACGDGEYIIYTALALKNKSFGQAIEFVWSNDSGMYATRESTSKIKVFKDFKEHRSFRPSFAAEGIFGGALLGVRSADFIDLYDWDEGRLIRRIDVTPRRAFWSESGELLVLACESSFYVLRYNAELVAKFVDGGVATGEQGIENSFELEHEIGEKVRQGHFVGDCFIYTNSQQRLNYYVGGEVLTLAHLPRPLYLLGYLPKENRVYLMNKQHEMFSYSLLLSVLVYQTAIVRRDFEGAKKALASIPSDQFNKLARFLESQDLKEQALELTTDPEHKFDLAIACSNLDLARSLVVENESETKWKQLGDLAMSSRFDLEFTQDCYERARDWSGLLLLHSSSGNATGMASLAEAARKSGQHNIAFMCHMLCGKIDDAIDLLVATDRIAEAAFLTRTYQPSRISEILALWKRNLATVSLPAAEALADPNDYADRFPDLQTAIRCEQWRNLPINQTNNLSASSYALGETEDRQTRDLIQMFKDGLITLDAPQSHQQTQHAVVQPPSIHSPVAVASPLASPTHSQTIAQPTILSPKSQSSMSRTQSSNSNSSSSHSRNASSDMTSPPIMSPVNQSIPEPINETIAQSDDQSIHIPISTPQPNEPTDDLDDFNEFDGDVNPSSAQDVDIDDEFKDFE